jgi:hypothetical protein
VLLVGIALVGAPDYQFASARLKAGAQRRHRD